MEMFSTSLKGRIYIHDIETAVGDEIDSLYFNANNKVLTYRSRLGTYAFIDTKTGGEIVQFNIGDEGLPINFVSVSDDGKLLFVCDGKYLYLKDLKTLKVAKRFNLNASHVERVYFSNDRSEIYVQTKNSFMVYNVSKSALIKRFAGNDWRHDPLIKTLTCVKESKTYATLFKFSLLNYKQIDLMQTGKIIKPYVDSINKVNKKSAKRFKFEYDATIGSLDVTGNLWITPAIEQPANTSCVLVFDFGQHRFTKLNSSVSQVIGSQWTGENQFMIVGEKKSELTDKISFESSLFANKKLTGWRTLPKEKIIDPIIINAEQKTAYTFSNKDLYVFQIETDGKASHIKNNELVNVSRNESFAFFNHKTQYSFYDLRNQNDLKPVAFTDSIVNKSGLFSDVDSLPDDYELTRLLGRKTIQLATEKSGLSLDLMSISATANKEIELRVNIKDKDGFMYSGAANKDWLNVWCNLMYVNNKDEVEQIKNFSIKEYNDLNTPQTAIALTLDYSGSMGEKRIEKLEKGISDMIDQKRDSDYIAIIKYDEDVITECTLIQNKAKLKNALHNTSYKKLSGGTAITDAVESAIELLIASNMDNKNIVLFTDGSDNSSMANYQEVIKKAKRYNIAIHAIGFGNQISETYLKDVSQQTKGNYYQIYSTNELEFIFDQIKNQANNYYSIKFKPKTPIKDLSKITVIANICLNNVITDTLGISVSTNKNGTFSNAQSTDKKESVNLDVLKTTPIQLLQDFKEVEIEKVEVPVSASKPKILENDSLNTEFGNLIFPAIKFVFDKTEIIKGTDEHIENVVLFMKKHRSVILEVQGHTDSKGNDEYNKSLSNARAEAVKQILIKMGVESNRLVARGYGEEQPIVPNDTDEHRLLNRRIDFVILSK